MANHVQHTLARQTVAGATIFVLFSELFIALRSKDIFAVDGAYRCLAVFHQQKILFHGNNHLLYPVNVFAWTQFLSTIGLRANGPIEFFSNVALMNCFAGAACLTIFFLLILSATRSWLLALMSTVGYGFSRAFIAQATNANEPMLGMFWSFLAVSFAVLYSYKRKFFGLLVASGCLFSLSMATYQSAVLLAPAAIAWLWLPLADLRSRPGLVRRRLFETAVLAFSAFLTAVPIYCWAYYRSGITGWRQMVRHFFIHEDARAYFGVGFSKLLRVPVGMLLNITPLIHSFKGPRELLAEDRYWGVLVLAAVIALMGFLSWSILWLLRNSSAKARIQPAGTHSLLVGLAFTIIPLCLWSPLYDKLWILPLGCICFLFALCVQAADSSWRAPFWVARGMTAALLVASIANFGWVLRSHRENPYEFAEVQRLEARIASSDLVVGEWDPISLIYGTLWADENRFISFPTEALMHGSSAVTQLQEMISETHRRGGKVYFLTLLDLSEPSWDGFLGRRCGIPYSSMNPYREHSTVRETFRTHAGEVTLRQLELELE